MRARTDDSTTTKPLEQTTDWPEPNSPTFARDFKSHVRNILLANPFFAGICADLWQSARPNSPVTKLLRANYKRILLTEEMKRNSMSGTRICKHIKVTGVRCGSPALRGEDYCYFHYRMLCSSRISHVALLENAEAIQASIMEVVNGLLRGTIDPKRGELVLRALNTAVRNSRHVLFERGSEMVRQLPKDRRVEDPIVPPRPPVPSKEELDAMKKAMLAGHSNSASATPVSQIDPIKTDPAKPDPAQRKPPVGVKQVAGTAEKKAHERTARQAGRARASAAP
jgi:hypothetical protein